MMEQELLMEEREPFELELKIEEKQKHFDVMSLKKTLINFQT